MKEASILVLNHRPSLSGVIPFCAKVLQKKSKLVLSKMDMGIWVGILFLGSVSFLIVILILGFLRETTYSHGLAIRARLVGIWPIWSFLEVFPLRFEELAPRYREFFIDILNAQIRRIHGLIQRIPAPQNIFVFI